MMAFKKWQKFYVKEVIRCPHGNFLAVRACRQGQTYSFVNVHLTGRCKQDALIEIGLILSDWNSDSVVVGGDFNYHDTNPVLQSWWETNNLLMLFAEFIPYALHGSQSQPPDGHG